MAVPLPSKGGRSDPRLTRRIFCRRFQAHHTGLGRAKPAGEPRDGLADLVWAVLLDEVASADDCLGQAWPGPDDLADALVDGLAAARSCPSTRIPSGRASASSGSYAPYPPKWEMGTPRAAASGGPV